MTLVYRNDQGRIEAVSSVDELDREEVPYSVLLTTTPSEVQKERHLHRRLRLFEL